MGWPQITIIVLFAISVGIGLAKHGEPRTGSYNFWHALVGSGLFVVPLYFGGFFTV